MERNWKAVLFDDDDHICTTTPPKGLVSTVVLPLAKADFTRQYMCINALDGEVDREPTEEWHHANRPRRAFANVTKLRSILVEFDERELIDQVDYVQGIEMPYSVLTFSGGKSFHFIVSLVEPCADRADYTQLVERLYAAVGGKPAGLDTSTKDASRLARTPDANRQQLDQTTGSYQLTGATQALVDVRTRIPRAQLEAWLSSRGFSKEAADSRLAALKAERAARSANQLPRWRQPLRGSTLNFLMQGAPNGSWNITCFKATCDMVRAGYTEDEILTKMEKAFGYLEASAVNTIRSAFRRAEYDKDVE